MKNIYFIRHAEGYHNLYNEKHNNWHLLYPRLTTHGIYQCIEAKNHINTHIIDVVLVSPLRRTLETAEHIFQKYHKFASTDLIKENVVNPCDFREPVEIISKSFNYVDFSEVNDDYNYNAQETPQDIKNRVDAFYYYLQQLPFENIAVVTHAVFLKSFLDVYGKKLNIEDNSWFKNCEIRIGTL